MPSDDAAPVFQLVEQSLDAAAAPLNIAAKLGRFPAARPGAMAAPRCSKWMASPLALRGFGSAGPLRRFERFVERRVSHVIHIIRDRLQACRQDNLKNLRSGKIRVKERLLIRLRNPTTLFHNRTTEVVQCRKTPVWNLAVIANCIDHFLRNTRLCTAQRVGRNAVIAPVLPRER